MDLNQLRTFVAVAEEEHLTRAAERLFTSQPAISAQLKALEETLGVTLFDRTPKGMRLTAAGERLLVQARATLESASQLLTQARTLRGELLGTLKVGVNTDFEFLQITRSMLELHRQHPGIQLSFMQSMSADILLDLRKGALDAGFFFGPCPTRDLFVLPLARVELGIIAPIAWADRCRDASIDALTQLPWVYASDRCPFVLVFEALMQDRLANLPKSVLVDNEEAVRQFVKAGAGLAMVRGDDARRAEQEGWGCRWSGTLPRIDLSAAVPLRRQQEPLIQAWLRTLEAVWGQSSTAEIPKEPQHSSAG